MLPRQSLSFIRRRSFRPGLLFGSLLFLLRLLQGIEVLLLGLLVGDNIPGQTDVIPAGMEITAKIKTPMIPGDGLRIVLLFKFPVALPERPFPAPGKPGQRED